MHYSYDGQRLFVAPRKVCVVCTAVARIGPRHCVVPRLLNNSINSRILSILPNLLYFLTYFIVDTEIIMKHGKWPGTSSRRRQLFTIHLFILV